MFMQPSVVYPGRKGKYYVSVTDAYGKPVAGADLTALSITKKFNTSHVPTLDLIMASITPTESFSIISIYTMTSLRLESLQNLTGKKWNPLMSLDTIERYKFLYPKNRRLRITFRANRFNLCRVSPFLVDTASGI